MTSPSVPTQLQIPIERVCALSLECWRLGQLANSLKHSNDGMVVARAVREIAEMLDEAGIGVIDLVGRSYDPGIVPEVLEVHIDPGLPEGSAVIDETVSPTVTWHGQVIKPGQITVRQAPAKPRDSVEGIA